MKSKAIRDNNTVHWSQHAMRIGLAMVIFGLPLMAGGASAGNGPLAPLTDNAVLLFGLAARIIARERGEEPGEHVVARHIPFVLRAVVVGLVRHAGVRPATICITAYIRLTVNKSKLYTNLKRLSDQGTPSPAAVKVPG